MCPYELANPNSTITCDVLRPLGVKQIAGPTNPNYPCDRCRSEWTDDTPPDPDDRSTWTPTLLAFVEPFEAMTPSPPPPAPCFHLGHVLVKSCCNRKRVYACDEPTLSGRDRVTVIDCQSCDAYDPDA